ncbi:hypothetical protein G7Y89_g8612 [Cudoniella acicularis]|uniref:Uncharacterized protein n=1 Tax=Cudoniella acicularis TaxID=354080 RepID=A0A8H4W0G4_9HELO|nr:hypothetical protein G7Y89_g8612 [Cudoniella acicularis]
MANQSNVPELDVGSAHFKITFSVSSKQELLHSSASLQNGSPHYHRDWNLRDLPPRRASHHVHLRRQTNLVSRRDAAAVTSTANSIQGMLRDLAPKLESGVATPDAPVTHWTMKSLSTSSYDTTVEVTRKAFRATTGFDIKFQDFNKLGELASTLSTTPNVTINSIQWALRDPTKKEMETQGRKLSVEDAIGKARDFADAFGARPRRKAGRSGGDSSE